MDGKGGGILPNGTAAALLEGTLLLIPAFVTLQEFGLRATRSFHFFKEG